MNRSADMSTANRRRFRVVRRGARTMVAPFPFVFAALICYMVAHLEDWLCEVWKDVFQIARSFAFLDEFGG